jgi:hypothetical protein
MESAALFFLPLMLAYQISIFLLILTFILAIINLKGESARSLLGLSIITFILFTPLWLIMLSSEVNNYFFTISIPIILLLTIFLHKSKLSSLLCLTATVISIIFISFTRGLMYLLIFLGGNFRGPILEIFSKINNLEILNLTSWVYYSVYLIIILSVLLALIFYPKQPTKKIIYSIFLFVLTIFCIGLTRDMLAYKTKITGPSSSGSAIKISNDVQKIAFLRNNHIWLTDTNGSNPFELTNNTEQIMSFSLSPDGKYVAYLTGGLDPKQNIYVGRTLTVVDTATKTLKVVNQVASEEKPTKNLSWNKDDL